MNIEEIKTAIKILEACVEEAKPEPLECWVKMYGSTFASVFDNKNEALANGLNDGWTIRKFREVIE